MKANVFIIKILFLIILFSCQPNKTPQETNVAAAVSREAKKMNEYLEKAFKEHLALHPTEQTRLGFKTDYDKWDDVTDSASQKDLQLMMKHLLYMKDSVNVEMLDKQNQISYRIFEQAGNAYLDMFPYSGVKFPVNPVDGLHKELPLFLIDYHTIENESDARAYISRISKLNNVVDQLIGNIKFRETYLILPPKHLYVKAIAQCKQLIGGTPLDNSSESNILYQDFFTKLQNLNLEEATKQELLKACEEALVNKFKPAYLKLIAVLEKQQSKGKESISIADYSNGKEYYQMLLDYHTDSYWVPEQIEMYGKTEMERIKTEMKAILDKEGFKGTLKEFYVLAKQKFAHSASAQTSNKLLDSLSGLIVHAQAKSSEVVKLKTKPQPIVLRAGEGFKGESLLRYNYLKPSPGLKRPGIFTVDPKEISTPEFSSVLYQVSYPGMHFQTVAAHQSAELPSFRKFGKFSAYENGWSLYSGYLAKEMGLIKDPYADFGRLAEELWRTANLVVESGIHYNGWSRTQAANYYKENTFTSSEEIDKMIDWQIVNPGQAASYKLGMMKIMDLRKKSSTWKKDKFDLKEFHEVILTRGEAPLTEVELWVKDWSNVKVQGFAQVDQNNANQ